MTFTLKITYLRQQLISLVSRRYDFRTRCLLVLVPAVADVVVVVGRVVGGIFVR